MADSDWIDVPSDSGNIASSSQIESDWIDVPDQASTQPVSAQPTEAQKLASVFPASGIAGRALQALMGQSNAPESQVGKADYSKDYQNIREAVPFGTAEEAAKQGYKTGQDVLGENLAGKALGTVFGGAMAAGTAFNPISKGLGYIPKIVQGRSEQAGELSARLDGTGSPTGEAGNVLAGGEVLPNVAPKAYNTGHPVLDTAMNLNSDLWTQIRKDPVNAAMLVEAARSPETIQALKTLPESMKVATWDKATKNTVAVNAKAILDSISNFTVRNLDKIKTPAHENALMAAFDPPSGEWQSTKKAVGNMATKLPELSEKYQIPMTSAKGMVALTDLGKKDLFNKYSEMSGQVPKVDLSPVAKAMYDIANKESVMTTDLKAASDIATEAQDFQNKIMHASDAEDILTELNAKNNKVFEESDKSSRATMLNSNPVLKARVQAAAALQRALVDAISPEYGQLRKDYGDLSHLNQMATRRSIAQEKYDARQSLTQNMSVLAAIHESGNPLKAASSLAAGKVMKIMGTPDFKFNVAAQKLSNLPKGMEKGTFVEASMGDKTFHGEYVGNSGKNIQVRIGSKIKTFTPDQVVKSRFNAAVPPPIPTNLPQYQVPSTAP